MATSTFVSVLAGQQALPTWLAIAPWILALLLVWSIIWKGMALWKAAQLSQKWWFIILLVINTFGILEIIYIFLIAKKYKVEMVEKTEETHL